MLDYIFDNFAVFCFCTFVTYIITKNATKDKFIKNEVKELKESFRAFVENIELGLQAYDENTINNTDIYFYLNLAYDKIINNNKENYNKDEYKNLKELIFELKNILIKETTILKIANKPINNKETK